MKPKATVHVTSLGQLKVNKVKKF